MKTPPAKQARLPKGRVMHTELPRLFSCIPQTFHHEPMPKDAFSRGFPVAVLPCLTRKAARALVKWHGLTREEKAHRVSILIYRQFHGIKPHREYERGYIENALAILALMEGKL